MIRTCLLGLGRTGLVVAEHLIRSADFELVSVYTKPKSLKVNCPLKRLINMDSQLTVHNTDDLGDEVLAKKIQVAVDFTTPKAVLKNARVLAAKGVHIVVGTTGFSKTQLSELRNIVEHYRIGMVYAPNISVGINILLMVVKTIARLLPSYDVEIIEYHHRFKKDAPSGTALKIANSVHDTKRAKRPRLIFGRSGVTEREPEEIGVHAIRAGGIVGVHKVLFSGSHDEIELTHRSYSRAVFADGALKAAKFIAGKAGFYNMEDVLLKEEEGRNEISTVTNQIVGWWRRIIAKAVSPCLKGLGFERK